ncbi:MAG: hypothetical protein L7U56_01800 [Acidimicrobiales bacterium]|nr:hypothetical protein [Acidimicrobiales bacterium]
MLSRLASDWMTIAVAMSIAITATIVMPTASAVAPIREADSDEQFTPQANNTTYWETGDAECVKFGSDPNGGAWGTEWIANGNYSLVVIKSAQRNGIFNGAQAGERLGSPSFNSSNQRQGISHIIACYDLVCETTGGVSAPAVNHSVIVFGGLGEPSYKSYNKTFGSHSPDNRGGIAVDGDADFHPSASSSWYGPSVITGSASGTGGPSNPSSGPFPYSQQAWIDYAASLAAAADADTDNTYSKVRVYRPEGGTRTITLDGGDVPSADAQTLHVVVGPGTLKMPDEKVDGAIIAPEATVLVDKSVQHFHGFVVAARFNDTTNDNGLQIHGQIPAALVDIPGDETCVPPTTLPPTTTTVAPTPAYGSLTIDCVVDTTYKGTVSVTAGDEVDENGKLHWKVAVVGEGPLFDGRLDPFRTFGPKERELELTPGSTVILAQKASVTGTEVRLDEKTVPDACPAPVPAGYVTVASECDAGITFAWDNTGDVGLTIKQYRDNVLVYDGPVAEGTSHAWDIEHSNLTPGNTAKVELWDGENLIDSAEVTYPGECPTASGSIINISVECESDVRYTVVNDGDLEFDHVYTVNGSGETYGTTVAGDTDDFAISADALEPGDGIIIELLDPESGEPFYVVTETYPEPCPQPVGDLVIECVVNNDYRISGSVTATDAGLAWGLDNRAPFLRLDGGRIGANVTHSFDDVYTLTPGSTVFLGEQGAGPDWIAFKTVPEGCPIDPTGDISIKCFVDDLYDVVAEIDGGSVGVKWMIRIKGGGGIVTKGSVPAFDDATIFLPAKQLEQGLVLVLRAPDNGGKLDSVTVPTSCFAPVSDALIALDTECDAEAKGSITNTGETTLIGNVHINDEILPGDIEIAPGETEEFTLPAELLEEGDVVKLVASGPEDYEREQALTYPEPCPTTTTVPPTTTVVIETPTTVPTTTTTVPTTTVPETTTTVPDTTTTTPDGGGTVAETPSAEPVEQTPTFTG